MCPRRYIQLNDGYMSKELWRKLIDEIYAASPDAIVLPFWRGESLLHPDFAELMAYALNKSCRIHISTNGHVLTDKQADVLAMCEFITFSVHTMKGYLNARKFLSTPKKGMPVVQISFVRGEKTADELLRKLVTAHNLDGFDSVRLYDEHSRGGVFGKSGHSPDTGRKFCPKLQDTLVVAFDGAVSRCNHIWKTEEEISLNNMSIKDVWSSKLIQKIRTDYPDASCMPCDQWTGHTCGESWRLVNGRIEHKVFGEAGV